MNTTTRWIVGAIAFLVCTGGATYAGAWHQRAADNQAAADAAAKASEHAADVAKQAADSATRLFADSMKTLAAKKAIADSDAARARRDLGRITVIGPVQPTTTSSTPAPEPGSVAADVPPDAAPVAIQRQGDAHVYVVPKFVVDLGAELRKSLESSQTEAAQAERNLAIARGVMRADSNTVRELRSALANRTTAEDIAKSNAGQDCRIAFVIHCPPRKVVAIGAFAVGVLGGVIIDRAITNGSARP